MSALAVAIDWLSGRTRACALDAEATRTTSRQVATWRMESSVDE
jgi:hypothetical protein